MVVLLNWIVERFMVYRRRMRISREVEAVEAGLMEMPEFRQFG